MKKPRAVRPWVLLLYLALWQAVSMAVGRELLLPSPVRVLVRLCELITQAAFWQTVGYTLLRISLGFLLGSLLGGGLALLSSRSRTAEALFAPLISTIKSVPVASFIILALIWFSSRRLSVLISLMMVLPVMYVNTLSGLKSVDPRLSEMAQVFRIPAGRRLRCVLLPQLMPYIRAGCSLALGLSWKSGVAAEVIGMPRGSIGERLQQAKVYLDTPDVFAWTVVIVCVSLCFEKTVLLLMDRLEARLERV